MTWIFQRRFTSLAAFFLFGFLPQGTTAEETRDARAVGAATRAAEYVGLAAATDEARHLRFEFFGRRLHHWDRGTGRHRLEGTTSEGQAYLVLHDVDSREGRVWLDGIELQGEERSRWLENAYGAWINDVYWLLMPAKMLDPGVHLAWEGEEELDGDLHDRVRLWFDEVGLTPGDRYWAWIRRGDGQMSRWAYHLQDWDAEREPTTWNWSGWSQVGPLRLASKRVNLGNGNEAGLGKIAVYDELPDAVYEDPDWQANEAQKESSLRD